MSEKGKEIEEEEEEIIDHWSHDHPLTLVETRRGDTCYGCGRRFTSVNQGYGCNKKCGYTKLLHEECAKMARKIRHPSHPQHILIQQHPQHILIQQHRHSRLWFGCSVCHTRRSFTIAYTCTSLECKFVMHMRCAQGGGVIDAVEDDDDEQSPTVIHHPSHPRHELKLVRRSCSFKCDACGTTQREKSYICTVSCQYWIHERCATLPQTMKREDHHHPLSLSFHVPPQYMKYDYKCEVCLGYLLPRYWIYHCELCRFAVHVKCVFKQSTHTTAANNVADEKGIIRFPINDVSMAEELIRPFVTRQGGAITIPPIVSHDDRYDCIHHKHQLTLISLSSSNHDPSEEESEEEDDYDYGKRSEKLICDGCITPISSPSSSSSNEYYYMSCSECKYYLHLACFHLQSELPSLPHLHQHDQDLLLQSCDKLKPWELKNCTVCDRNTNGLFYACTKCNFKVDIKCASMPDTIYHAAHPQHLLNLLSEEDNLLKGLFCAGCGFPASDWNSYACDSCDFTLHVRCAVLPASITSRRWDKHHPLPLTFDANVNHPGDFYCDQCETEMNPKSLMYHCRQCDLSFHPECFETTSGWWKNIKFGQEFMINGAAAHPHPLTYQLLTTKRRCDLCGEYRHEYRGFHCASCNFFICLYDCGEKMFKDGDMMAVD